MGEFSPDGRWQQQSEGTQPDSAAAQPQEAAPDKLKRWLDVPNIAAELDDEKLGSIGMLVHQEWKVDEGSRSDWRKKIEDAIKLAMQVSEPKNYPWPKASCCSLDTDILTDTGWRPISDVKVGELVYSRAPDGAAAFYPVEKTFRGMADNVVHFEGKSIDLLVTTNHRMLVEREAPNAPKKTFFLEAGEFLDKPLQWYYLPLTSEWSGEAPQEIYGLEPSDYVELLGWYVSEGSAQYGVTPAGADTVGSLSIAQSRSANPVKYARICDLLDRCGFSYTPRDTTICVHARSMPVELADEFRSLGKVAEKHLPAHVMCLSASLLALLLDAMVAGDGCTRVRDGRRPHRMYFTTSQLLGDQVQEICQKIGLRGTIGTTEPRVGGEINGRTITGARRGYRVEINAKPRVRVFTMKRTLEAFNAEVACVEVGPFNTIYVRRNGKAVWVGNSVVYPLMTTAAMQFAARAYPAIIANRAVVKGIVLGRDEGTPQVGPDGQPVVDPTTGQPAWAVPPGALQSRADRIGSHMSWQLLDQMPEWEPETDALLHSLPIQGTMFRKSYFDPARGRNMSLVVPPLKLCVNYWAKSLALAPRQTEEVSFYPYEIREFERAKLWLERRYTTDPTPADHGSSGPDDDAPIVFLEQHRWLDLDGDNYPEPYTVTVDREGQQVVRIVARFEESGLKFDPVDPTRVLRIEPLQFYTQYDFLPSLDGGIYGTGFGQLLGPINAAVNTTLNMLIDAGHLANTNGGFVAKNLSIQAGTLRWTMGEFKPVNAGAMPLRDSILPLPFAGPSQVLFALLGTLIDAGKDVSSLKDVLAGEQPQANVPATTVLALIEQGQKMYTGIFKRIYRALKEELDKIKRLNLTYMPETQDFQIAEKWFQISRQDYVAGAGVAPIADPTMATEAQMLARAQYLMQFRGDPLVKQDELTTRLLKAASIDDIDKLMNSNPPTPPQIAIKGLELEIKGRQADAKEMLARAQALNQFAQAALAVANADKAVGDQHLAWVNQSMQTWESQFEATMRVAEMQGEDQANAGQPGQPGSGGPPAAPPSLPAGPVGTGIPPMATSPS